MLCPLNNFAIPPFPRDDYINYIGGFYGAFLEILFLVRVSRISNDCLGIVFCVKSFYYFLSNNVP